MKHNNSGFSIWYGICKTFKLNKNLIIFYGLLWAIIIILIFTIVILVQTNDIGIFVFNVTGLEVSNSSGNISTLSPFSLSNTIGRILLYGFGIIIFSIFSFSLLNKILYSEIKNNRITIWFSSNLSRSKIFIIKFLSVIIIDLLYLFILSIICCIFLPFSKKFNYIYLFKIFFQELNMLWVVFFVMTIFTALFFLKENKTTVNCLFATFIVFYFLIYIFHILHLTNYDGGQINNNDTNNDSFGVKIGNILEKIDFSSLVFDLFQQNPYSKEVVQSDFSKKSTIWAYYFKKTNMLNLAISFFLVNSLSSCLFYYSFRRFNTRDFNI